MNIQIWPPHLKVSGGNRVTLAYADQLARRGHSVTVVVLCKDRLRRIVGNALGWKPSWQRSLKARIVRVNKWKNAPRADVVIADSWQNARALGTHITSSRKFHFIQHDERLYHGPSEEVAAVYQLPLHKLTVSTWLKEMLHAEFSQEATLLLNPTDRTLFFPTTRNASHQLRILMLEHTYDWKGTKEGIEVVERLRREIPDLELVLFGARIDEAPAVPAERHVNPPQEKLRDLYSSCDIFLSPSWSEGSGLPAMEAMACGTAVVTYDNGGSRDYAVHEKTALVARPKDTEDLFQNLRRMARDTELRHQLAEAGRLHVLSMPTLEEQTTHLEAVLQGS
jgi:glycosyltransferase involved in cell wall biosynthesis